MRASVRLKLPSARWSTRSRSTSSTRLPGRSRAVPQAARAARSASAASSWGLLAAASVGAGLFMGVDIVEPGTTEPDRALAVRLIEKLRKNRVLISLCGPFGSVLKVRPPLVFDGDDLDFFVSALEKSLVELGK